MRVHEERLKALREELTRRRLDGFVVPLTDEHMSEYVGAYARQLAWLTGFEGSAGWAVVLAAKAAVFVDGRYTLQVREQVDEQHWSCQSVSQTSVAAWLGEHAPAGARVGYVPWLHTKGWVHTARAALSKRSAELVPLTSSPVDAVWFDRPAFPSSKLAIQPIEFAGKTAAAKCRDIATWLASMNADAVVLSALDSIAWSFNIRGRDVSHTPVALAYAVVHADSSADLFVAPEKLTDDVVRHLGDAVRLHWRDSFPSYLQTLTGKSIAVDPERAVVAIFDALEGAGAKVVEARDPVVLPKAIKNESEIAGHREAQSRDAAALSRFLHWFSLQAPKGLLTELSASEQLCKFREETGKLLDTSFDTISAFGPNAAIVHYRADERTCRRILPGSLYLVDSGGQYADGTTDVTRTVAIGAATAQMRDRFTRVLKGHIALAQAVFPLGTRGGQLDVLARQYLWAVGLDYAHGTGHGVGAYLSVHEGPQRISLTGDYNDPLLPGMILSNEPGYYKTGEYGIRIENLMLVVRREIPGAEQPMLGFDTLTFAPIDRTLIDPPMLTMDERTWLDTYHAEVAALVAPQLEGAAKVWLQDATRAL